MLKASGEEALAIALTDFPTEELPVRVLAIKRHLQRVVRQPRFKQRLVQSDGQILADDVVLQVPMDLQLILLQFEASSQDQIQQLQQAAGDNFLLVVEQLLQRPQDPDLEDEDAWVALHFACEHGSDAAVRLLLKAKADKDKATHAEETPMWMASQEGHLEVVHLLLEASADKDKAKDDGKTPLHAASQEGHLEVVRLLLGANADKHKAETGGATALHAAKMMAQLRCMWLRMKATWTWLGCSRPTLRRIRPLIAAQRRCRWLRMKATRTS